MVKLFGWEAKMSDMLAKKRDEELEWIMSKELAGLANNVVNYFIPILQMIGTYASFTLIMKGNLTPSLVFSTMAVFDLLRDRTLTRQYMLAECVLIIFQSCTPCSS